MDIGAPTDAVRARYFAAGQALGRAVHEEHTDVDGFIYASRLTGDDCIAVFERAVGKMKVDEACDLKDAEELPAVLERHKLALLEECRLRHTEGCTNKEVKIANGMLRANSGG